VLDVIDANSGLKNHQKTERALEDRPELKEQVETFEFERTGEHFKIERTTGPAIVDRKTHYSHRPGVANRIEIIYDPQEIGHKVTLYRQVDSEWEAVDIRSLDL
jgi:hypothetical protein